MGFRGNETDDNSAMLTSFMETDLRTERSAKDKTFKTRHSQLGKEPDRTSRNINVS